LRRCPPHHNARDHSPKFPPSSLCCARHLSSLYRALAFMESCIALPRIPFSESSQTSIISLLSRPLRIPEPPQSSLLPNSPRCHRVLFRFSQTFFLYGLSTGVPSVRPQHLGHHSPSLFFLRNEFFPPLPKDLIFFVREMFLLRASLLNSLEILAFTLSCAGFPSTRSFGAAVSGAFKRPLNSFRSPEWIERRLPGLAQLIYASNEPFPLLILCSGILPLLLWLPPGNPSIPGLTAIKVLLVFA